MPESLSFQWRLRFVAVAVVVAYWGAMFVSTHITVPGPVVEHGPSDKSMHLVAYAGLAFLWLTAAAAFGPVSWLSYVVVLIAAAVYGAVDEVSQSIVGRDTDLADWRYDMLGAALGTAAFAAAYSAWLRRGSKRIPTTEDGPQP